MVLSDGDNSLNVISDFTVKIYVWDGSNPTFVKTYNISGFHQMSSLTYSGETVDLSSLQLPAGSYRLGIYVDADDDIPNPPDDPSDNSYLVGDAFDFTPATSAVPTEKEQQNKFVVYPNPVMNDLTVNWASLNNYTSAKELSIVNLMGEKVMNYSMDNLQTSATINVENLPKGMYILTLKTDEQTLMKKFIKE